MHSSVDSRGVMQQLQERGILVTMVRVQDHKGGSQGGLQRGVTKGGHKGDLQR